MVAETVAVVVVVLPVGPESVLVVLWNVAFVAEAD